MSNKNPFAALEDISEPGSTPSKGKVEVKKPSVKDGETKTAATKPPTNLESQVKPTAKKQIIGDLPKEQVKKTTQPKEITKAKPVADSSSGSNNKGKGSVDTSFEQVKKVNGPTKKPQTTTTSTTNSTSVREPKINGGSVPLVGHRDIREDIEKNQHGQKLGFRDQRTGEPRLGHAKQRGRFHDHHLSGTGRGKEVKKGGAGAHSWGKATEIGLDETLEEGATETQMATEEDGAQEVQTGEDQGNGDSGENKGETPKVDDKKALRKKRKEEEKLMKKRMKKQGVTDSKMEKEVRLADLHLNDADPNQKTFEDYQRELLQKKQAVLSNVLKVIPTAKVEKQPIGTSKSGSSATATATKATVTAKDIFAASTDAFGRSSGGSRQRRGQTSSNQQVDPEKDFPQLK
jgi:hypothetical protein